MRTVCGAELTDASSIFRGYSAEELALFIAPLGCFREYDPGEMILCRGKDSDRVSICIILSGKAVIRSCDKQKATLLRFVSAGSEVGAAGVFSSSPIDTTVTACGDSPVSVFLMSREAVFGLIDKPEVVLFRNNLLNLLSDKVHFLNERISCVTGGSADRRLAFYLNSCMTCEDGTVDVGMSMTALAFSLDIGRASLYRAFDSLSSAGIIRREENRIIIDNRKKLKKLIY